MTNVTTAPKVALGQAIQAARNDAGLSQVALAEAIGIDQPRLSRYIRGIDLVPYELLPLIDKACGRRLGFVLERAGFVDREIDLETAIETVPDVIDEVDRSALLGLYRVFKARHLGNGNVMPSPRTPGMTRAEEALDRATEEQRRRDAPPAAG